MGSKKYVECSRCKGSGKEWWPGCDDQAAICRDCDGSGEVAKQKRRSKQ